VTRRWRRDEGGSIALFFAVLFPALLVLVGLVADGGMALAAKAKASSDAREAARAGADALSPAALELRGTPVIDQHLAFNAAQAALGAEGAQGTVNVAGRTVTVQVTHSTPSVLLGAVGVHVLTVNATESATSQEGH
jgi:Flp pilus assembly protein TadG